jgi:hypothetical protein
MTSFNFQPPGPRAATPAKVMPFPGRAPERLVGVGFRCWLTGFDTGDVSAWEEAWTTYQAALGHDAAKPLLLSLSQFVRGVKANCCRDIEVYPLECRGFCRDECLAISLIAASQHDRRPELRTCAAALTGSDDIGDALLGAQQFAAGLREAQQILSPSSICPADCPLWQPRKKLS